MDPLTAIYLGSTLLSTAGSLFGGDTRKEQLYEEMMRRYKKGIDPNILKRMKEQAVGRIGSEFAGISGSTSSRLLRENVPTSVRESILEKLATRRGGATAEALTNIDALNEQMKMDVLGSMSRMPLEEEGFGFPSLAGMSISGLMQMAQQREFFKKLKDLYGTSGYNFTPAYQQNPMMMPA